MAVAMTVTLSCWVNLRWLKADVLFTSPDEPVHFVNHERRHLKRQSTIGENCRSTTVWTPCCQPSFLGKNVRWLGRGVPLHQNGPPVIDESGQVAKFENVMVHRTMTRRTLETLSFDNTYARLPQVCYARVNLTPFSAPPYLVHANPEAAPPGLRLFQGRQ